MDTLFSCQGQFNPIRETFLEWNKLLTSHLQCFLTNRANTELATVLEKGMKKHMMMVALRSIIQFILKSKLFFRDANLKNRIELEIENPIITSKTSSIP